jgi:hypothetical protein
MLPCNRLVIGADGDLNWYYSGAITELRLWSVERTAAQINDNMHYRIPGAATGLIASYALDTYQTGQSIVDRSGAGCNGIMHGAPASVAGPNAILK